MVDSKKVALNEFEFLETIGTGNIIHLTKVPLEESD
jgi:hypothetical protein